MTTPDASAARPVGGSPGPVVLTVILNYRTPDMTLESATAALREMAGIDGEIVVVDNDSGDGSFEKLSAGLASRPRVRVLASGRNGGFGAGNNFGVRAGLSDGRRPDYVYLLNSDAFPGPGAIRALLDHLEAHPRVGFAGSYIHGPDGAPHCTAFRYVSAPGEFEAAARTGPITRLLSRWVVPLPIPETTREVDWAAGASLMLRRAALDEIGLFDEGFFLYFEETDLCRRARRAGWPTVFVRESVVMHIGSVSTGVKTTRRTPQYWYDSRLRYFVKHHGRLGAAAATAAYVSGGLLWRLRCALQRRPVGDPPGHLRDMIAHAARHAISSLGRDLRRMRTAAAGGEGARRA